MNIEPRAFYMYETAAKNPQVFALLSEQPVVIFHSATKQDHRFFFFFSIFTNWRICCASVYCFTVSNYWAMECQMVNKLPHCYSGAHLLGRAVERALSTWSVGLLRGGLTPLATPLLLRLGHKRTSDRQPLPVN